jgi:xanthosine utilization system XapX-like protein
LFGEVVLPATALGPVPVPLTFGQKARLLAGCLPVFTFGLMVAGYLYLVSRSIVPAPPWLLWLVLGAVILLYGYQTIQNLRDLVSGTALVQEDLLNRSYRGRGGQGKGTCFGTFERLGTLRMVPGAYFQNSPGQRYRVIYSPASKTVWALEPPEARVRG